MDAMGQVWSTIESMMGPDVDERDVRLAVRMVRDHHAAIMEARVDNVPVRWGQRAHLNPVFVLNPVQTEWDYIEQILENVPLPTYQALAEEGIPLMLEELQDFQSDENSQYEWEHDHCSICHSIAYDEDDADLVDGPIGTERFFARHGNRTLPGGWQWPNNHGANTGHARNRRVWGDNM